MALIGRYSVLSKHPGRDVGGGATGLGQNRGDFSKNSQSRARFTSADWHSKSGVPDGYRPPAAWIWPQSSGGLGAHKTITGEGEFTAAGAMGVNGEALLTGIGTLSGDGQLVVSAVATLTGSGSITNAAAVAYLNAAATLAGAGSVTAAIEALGNAVAALTGTGTVTPTVSALGELSADLTPFTELSPQSLATAVWEALASDLSGDTGSMGSRVNFMYLLAHNKVVTDPSAGTMTVFDSDGSTVLYVADLFQDAAGVTPYAGAGAERREQFA